MKKRFFLIAATLFLLFCNSCSKETQRIEKYETGTVIDCCHVPQHTRTSSTYINGHFSFYTVTTPAVYSVEIYLPGMGKNITVYGEQNYMICRERKNVDVQYEQVFFENGTCKAKNINICN